MPEHQLHRLHVGAGGYGKAGCGVAQLVRRQSNQSDFSAAGSKNRGRKFVLRSTPPSGAVNTSRRAFPARWCARSSANDCVGYQISDVEKAADRCQDAQCEAEDFFIGCL